jgi:hypothetical protein
MMSGYILDPASREVLRRQKSITSLIAEIERGNPSINEPRLQGFAIKLRSVPAVGLTTGIYQHLNQLQTQQIHEPFDCDIAVTDRVDSHVWPAVRRSAVIYHRPIQKPNQRVLNHDGPGAGTMSR